MTIIGNGPLEPSCFGPLPAHVMSAFSIRALAASVFLAVALCPPAWAGHALPTLPPLVPMRFTARNDGAQPIACTVATAHWYSVELGSATPGKRISRTFWSDPSTGTVFILNARRDRIPVEILWCGIAGRTWDTRAAIDLDHRAGRRPEPLHLACRADGDRLQCRSLARGRA